MDISGVLTAICRVAGVLAVAGMLAMHGLTTGHHAELPVAGGAGAHTSVMADAVMSDAVIITTPDGPTSPERLAGLCMAVLLVAATTLLLLLARARRRGRPWSDMTSTVPRWSLHVPSPRAPCLFTLGVLRT